MCFAVGTKIPFRGLAFSSGDSVRYGKWFANEFSVDCRIILWLSVQANALLDESLSKLLSVVNTIGWPIAMLTRVINVGPLIQKEPSSMLIPTNEISNFSTIIITVCLL